MGFEDLKKLKEQNAPYFIALLGRFDRYAPVELVDFLSQNPDSKEFVWDYINATSCHPDYRRQFTNELQRRRIARDIAFEVEDALIDR
jgi:hypothetical protein